jgi:hypothetical protein
VNNGNEKRKKFPQFTTLCRKQKKGPYECNTIMTSPRSTSLCNRRNNHLIGVVDAPDDSSHNEDKPTIPQSPPVKRRLVTFNNSIRVWRTLHLNSYSDVELAACWYSALEFTIICGNARLSGNLSKKEEVHTEEDDQHHDYDCCLRGVECFTRRGAHQRLKNKTSGRNAVFTEQVHQWEEGVHRPEHIAEVYKIAAADAKAQAIQTGRKDQIHARVVFIPPGMVHINSKLD